MTERKFSTVVIGEGWAALGAVGFLLGENADTSVCWVSGSATRLLPALPSVRAGSSARAWKDLAARFGLEVEATAAETGGSEGVYVREFRNKSFRAPAWSKAESDEHASELIDENLGGPERRLVSNPECRLDIDLLQLEDAIRRCVLRDSRVERRQGIPVAEVKLPDLNGESDGCSVVLASGEEIRCDRIIYADRWSAIRAIKGMPEALVSPSGGKLKTLDISRKFRPHGALQVIFTHDVPVGSEMIDGFYSSVQKEAGESVERHVWGYFFEVRAESDGERMEEAPRDPAEMNSGRRRGKRGRSQPVSSTEPGVSPYELNLSAVLRPGAESGTRSIWTFFLEPEETDDNHLIAKKLRRIKQTLNRTFAAGGWLPEGKSDFTSTVSGEHVRFQESVIFAEGEPIREPMFAAVPGRRKHARADVRSDGSPIVFLTDGFGPSCALNQVASLFGVSNSDEVSTADPAGAGLDEEDPAPVRDAAPDSSHAAP